MKTFIYNFLTKIFVQFSDSAAVCSFVLHELPTVLRFVWLIILFGSKRWFQCLDASLFSSSRTINGIKSPTQTRNSNRKEELYSHKHTQKMVERMNSQIDNHLHIKDTKLKQFPLKFKLKRKIFNTKKMNESKEKIMFTKT